ncbi:unnamed protein product [Amoebophrya sp. A120]|nr:unnamed protein product [Amoebophrya sp. A120]|eukprot:GSA120T00019811001.1
MPKFAVAASPKRSASPKARAVKKRPDSAKSAGDLTAASGDAGTAGDVLGTHDPADELLMVKKLPAARDFLNSAIVFLKKGAPPRPRVEVVKDLSKSPLTQDFDAAPTPEIPERLPRVDASNTSTENNALQVEIASPANKLPRTSGDAEDEKRDPSLASKYEDFFNPAARPLRDCFCRVIIRNEDGPEERLEAAVDAFLTAHNLLDPPPKPFLRIPPLEKEHAPNLCFKALADFVKVKLKILDGLVKAQQAMDPRGPLREALHEHKLIREREQQAEKNARGMCDWATKAISTVSQAVMFKKERDGDIISPSVSKESSGSNSGQGSAGVNANTAAGAVSFNTSTSKPEPKSATTPVKDVSRNRNVDGSGAESSTFEGASPSVGLETIHETTESLASGAASPAVAVEVS